MLKNKQLTALAGWSGVDTRTITRWYAGFTVRKDTSARLSDAVRELHLPFPLGLRAGKQGTAAYFRKPVR